MIKLTKLKGDKFILNADQILHIEKCGDTIVHYPGGAVRVKETPEQVVNRSLKWHQKKWIPIVSDNLES